MWKFYNFPKHQIWPTLKFCFFLTTTYIWYIVMFGWHHLVYVLMVSLILFRFSFRLIYTWMLICQLSIDIDSNNEIFLNCKMWILLPFVIIYVNIICVLWINDRLRTHLHVDVGWRKKKMSDIYERVFYKWLCHELGFKLSSFQLFYIWRDTLNVFTQTIHPSNTARLPFICQESFIWRTIIIVVMS
jgi:hypothetical protein